MTDFPPVPARREAVEAPWPQDWPVLINSLREIERAAREERPEVDDPDYVRFMPYELSRFAMLLTDAVGAAPGPDFLDVGAGPGTKVLFAQQLYDLEAYGIEIVPEFCIAAAKLGAQVVLCDARIYGGYKSHDIVYLNRPLQDRAFERHVMDAMKPGAVLITVNGMTRPAGIEWETIAEEYDAGGPVHGVWRKPS